MARYFFHLHEDAVFRDEEGSEFPDLDAARENALRSAREMACAEVMEGQLVLSHSIEIVDDSGRQVGEVSYADAVGLSE
jgi:hypothetical protein